MGSPGRIGSYRVEGRLGEGGMGAVYRARDADGRAVALKVLKKDLVHEDEYRARFLREAKIALGLDHPHIVRALDAGEVSGQLYLASELVEGGSLADLLARKGALSERRALELCRGIVSALDHAHRRGLIHRDIKPENILLTGEGEPKVTDLGLARSVDAARTRYTRDGEALGTPSYLAPEQARGEVELDIRCDLYSVGASLFELLTGTVPYTGPTYLDVLHAHLYAEIPDPGDRRADLGLGVRRLVMDLLQKRPDERPKDPATVLRRIDLLLPEAAKLPAPPVAPADGPRFPSTIQEEGAAPAPGGARAHLQTVDEIPAFEQDTDRGAPAPSSASADDDTARGEWRPEPDVPGAERVAIVRRAPEPRTWFVVGGDRLQLGRNGIDRSTNDLTVRLLPGAAHREANLRISGDHLRVSLEPDGAYAHDLGSANGTWIDGDPLRCGAPRALGVAATLDLADALKLRARFQRAEGPAGAVTGRGPIGARGALLLERIGNREDMSYALVDGVLRLDGVEVVRAAGQLFVRGRAGGPALYADGDEVPAGACAPLVSGGRFEAGGAEYDVVPIQAEAMK